MKKTPLLITIIIASILLFTSSIEIAKAYSNGGYSTDPSNPDYGTHDWIAQHALDWLPTREKQYILDNLAAYLYGTELPEEGHLLHFSSYSLTNGFYLNSSSTKSTIEICFDEGNFSRPVLSAIKISLLLIAIFIIAYTSIMKKTLAKTKRNLAISKKILYANTTLKSEN